MAKDNENKEDYLFHEAAMDSAFNSFVVKNKEDELPKKIEGENNIRVEIERRLKEGETDWDALRRLMEGGFTDRFIQALNNMGDKDFVRNYLKLLEHFKPKLIRASLGETDKPDTVIQVQTVIRHEDGSKEIIDITDIQETDG